MVFEDDELIVIDKPAGLVVHPAAGNWTGTLVNALVAHCGDSLSGIGGVKRPGIVHRLDKDTTGLMVVAKTDRAHRALSRQFADHGRSGPLRRGYLAFVWGAPDRPRGTIDKPIDRHPRARDKMAVRAGGREAITHWEVLERYHGTDGKPVASLLACRLETGRTHQIRVHLASIGHPLLGDDVYGPGFKTKASHLGARGPRRPGGPWQTGLHAYLLAIEHPIAGQESGVPIGTAGRSRSFTPWPRCPGHARLDRESFHPINGLGAVTDRGSRRRDAELTSFRPRLSCNVAAAIAVRGRNMDRHRRLGERRCAPPAGHRGQT